ncbi:MAG: RagB/SusD family nutrient uptake outer membrane protein [Bacteroidia bacterium]|nr:RagB/SusD family nutrient uptake outer membrane protein [Bacteroidia bacterium]
MKKHIIISAIGAFALMTLCSCNQDLLNIPQKGVVAYEDFYKTDEDAESALVSVYAQAITVVSSGTNGINNPSYNVVVNAPGDEMYWGGGKKNGSSSGAQDMNEFRNTYDNTIGHLKYIYRQMYALIYRANLVIDNFYGENGELCDSQVKKRCVAEARVFRAWAHFFLACYWGTPPLVDHVLAGDARPTNCDHDVLMDWIINEYKLALPDLEARKGPQDKNGAIKVTSGTCLALLGKAQVFAEDYAGAKSSLKQVIDSGNYALVPTDQIADLFNCKGDCNEEKVFEMNYDYHTNIGAFSGKYHYQRNNALFFRLVKMPSKFIQPEGWGNNCAPTRKFADAMIAHEGDSPRRKAWFLSYEEFITELEYASDTPGMTKEEKLMDPKRGFTPTSSYDELYANYGYFFVKFMPLQADLIPNSSTVTDENRIIMRYAEVLLLYAEACAKAGDGDGSGLKALQEVQKRAGAPVSQTLTMEDVKQENWFELAWEGTRFLNLVRWGDAAKELAFKSVEETPYFSDEFYAVGSHGKTLTGQPHKTRLTWKDDGWAASGGGFKAGKHELYPFPFSVTEQNPWDPEKGVGIKQNPGWE